MDVGYALGPNNGGLSDISATMLDRARQGFGFNVRRIAIRGKLYLWRVYSLADHAPGILLLRHQLAQNSQLCLQDGLPEQTAAWLWLNHIRRIPMSLTRTIV